jgi:isopenicillin N synthase-like dioxygenase
MSGLPVLDFRQFEGLPPERAAFLRALGDAARDVGFFYLVGHGIDEMLTNSIVATSRRFFTLPERDKLAIEMALSPHFRG